VTSSTDTTSTANSTPRPGSRAARARMPMAADVVHEAAVNHGVCVRPVAMKVTDTQTGEITFVDVPCGATLAAKCPTCAERARRLRMHQCREGWHLDAEPLLEADAPTGRQVELAIERADLTVVRDDLAAAGDEGTVAAVRESLADVDIDLRKAGVRGEVEPAARGRRVRTTRRRSDVPDLPRRETSPTTLGRTFTARDGAVFRPSMFLTVTLPSYGRVQGDGTPVDPARYDYQRAARDALVFSRLLDRLVQNLRRVAGYDVQYFATVEPQRRLVPHAHFAIRGTLPRALVRQVVAATYHRVWWPATSEPAYDEHAAPVWTGAGYADPVTFEQLPTWEDALDQLDELGDHAEPRHTIRFGPQVDVQGLLAGSADADRRIGYLAKYLTKSMNDAHTSAAATTEQKAHVDRLHAALKEEPCSPGCSNWLRYGIQPKKPREGMTPGGCRSKAHKRAYLGYGGRRILVSRRWSGKTLADHKHDRRAWVFATLGVTDDRTNDKTRDRFVWQPATHHDDVRPLPTRLLHAIAERARWRAAYESAKQGQPPPTNGESAVNDGLTHEPRDSATDTDRGEAAA
jgi:hypothetical protein